MLGFHLAAALVALLVLARNLGRARPLIAPGLPASQRAGAMAPLLACLVALAVLWVAVKGLLAGLMNQGGGPP